MRYVMLAAISIVGTVDELENYATRIAAGYRPPMNDDLPAELVSLLSDCWAQVGSCCLGNFCRRSDGNEAIGSFELFNLW